MNTTLSFRAGFAGGVGRRPRGAGRYGTVWDGMRRYGTTVGGPTPDDVMPHHVECSPMIDPIVLPAVMDRNWAVINS